MGMVPRFSPSLSAPLCPNGASIDPRPPGTSFVLIPGLPHISIDTAVMGFRGRMPFSTRNVREAGGVLTVYPDNGSPPGTSSLNFSAGQTVANLVTVEPFNSDIAIYNQSSGSVQIVVDEQGYYIAPP